MRRRSISSHEKTNRSFPLSWRCLGLCEEPARARERTGDRVSRRSPVGTFTVVVRVVSCSVEREEPLWKENAIFLVYNMKRPGWRCQKFCQTCRILKPKILLATRAVRVPSAIAATAAPVGVASKDKRPGRRNALRLSGCSCWPLSLLLLNGQSNWHQRINCLL